VLFRYAMLDGREETAFVRYIKQYNKTATPFRWRYKNADHRIKSDHSTSL